MRTKAPFAPVFAIIFSCLIISCKKSVDRIPAKSKDVILPANGTSVVEAHNRFAFDFLRETLENDLTSANKLTSPLSIYMALGMVSNGAQSTTLDGIKETLRLGNTNIDDLNKTCQALIEQLPQADNKVELNIANAIFYRQTILPVQGFLSINDTYYHAEVKSLDFTNPNALPTINKWASDHTHQKIEKVLDEIKKDDLMFLLNAIYFKGTWQYPFDKSKNQSMPFFLDNGGTTPATFMFQHEMKLNYFGNDSLQMVELPYGGGNFNMYVLMPGKNVSVKDLVSSVKGADFHNWQTQLHPFTTDIYFPKFKFRYDIEDMRPHLGDMGMGLSFTSYADFLKMYQLPEVYITRAVHKTYIEVNEEGTEAAAVTTIGVAGVTAALPPVIRFDHPFLFIIAEKSSGAILFTGLMNNPSAP